MGWFFGFKLHVVMNHKGQLMAIKITPGNVDDRAPLEEMIEGLEGKLVADKGYISKNSSRDFGARACTSSQGSYVT